MDLLKAILSFIGITSFALMLAGLFKPWVMLWWESEQNRRRVIKLYGGISVTSGMLYWLLIKL